MASNPKKPVPFKPAESDIEPAPPPLNPVSNKGQPVLKSPVAQAFYTDSLRELSALGLPFLLGGTYAVCAYTGISRATKDLDIFCKAGDYPRILNHFRRLGYAIGIEDERWIAKVYHGNQFFDVIFASWNGTMPINDDWFVNARQLEVFGTLVDIVGPTEMIWSKAFIQLRHRYDGADVVHMILKQHDQIDWHRLLNYMEQYWEVLLMHLMNFRWIYPSERDNVPRWLMDELLDRMHNQLEMPPSNVRMCRGRMFSRIDYEPDIKQWGFADLGGEGYWQGNE